MTPVAIGDTQGTPGSPKPCITSKTVTAAWSVSTNILKMKLLPLLVQDLQPEQIHRQTYIHTDRQTDTHTERQTRLKLLPYPHMVITT